MQIYLKFNHIRYRILIFMLLNYYLEQIYNLKENIINIEINLHNN